MTTSGRWATVRFPDGRVRHDWVPAAQPPSPRGERGCWHVVPGDSRRPNRWEWHRDEGPPEMPPAPPESLPPVRPERPAEVPTEHVYRTKRGMGVWFWLGAVILAAIGGAGAVAMTHENRAEASFAVDARPDNDVPRDDRKPTRAGLIAVAEGYLNALLAGDLDDLVSYLDPSCDGADPGYAVAARWAEEFAGGAEVSVEEVEVRGRRGSVTDFDLSGAVDDDVRDLVSDVTPNGEQAFPWRFHDGEWYFKGECGSPSITPGPDDRTSTVPDGGDDEAEH